MRTLRLTTIALALAGSLAVGPVVLAPTAFAGDRGGANNIVDVVGHRGARVPGAGERPGGDGRG